VTGVDYVVRAWGVYSRARAGHTQQPPAS
jgi:hypothetical protein